MKTWRDNYFKFGILSMAEHKYLLNVIKTQAQTQNEITEFIMLCELN